MGGGGGGGTELPYLLSTAGCIFILSNAFWDTLLESQLLN